MENRLIEIKAKLDKMDDKLDEMQLVQIKQAVILDEHISRTEALEKALQYTKEKDIEPLKQQSYMLNGVFKFIGITSSILGLVFTILKLFSIL